MSKETADEPRVAADYSGGNRSASDCVIKMWEFARRMPDRVAVHEGTVADVSLGCGQKCYQSSTLL